MGVHKPQTPKSQQAGKAWQPEGRTLARELDVAKRQQMEAVRFLSDWSKWIVTLETAAIGGIFAWVKANSTGHAPGWHALPMVLLVFAAVCFVISIYFAAQVLFSLPDIVEQLPRAEQSSINDMKGDYMGAGLLAYERRQWHFFIAGLLFVILGALFTLVVSYVAPQPSNSTTTTTSIANDSLRQPTPPEPRSSPRAQ